MAQRQITSFFTKTPKSNDEGQTSRITNLQEEDGGQNNKNHNTSKDESPSSSPTKKVEQNANFNKKSPFTNNKIKGNMNKRSPRILNGSGKSKKSPVSATKKKQTTVNTKINGNSISKKRNETSGSSDSDSEFVVAKRSRISQILDSSDEELGKTLLASPIKSIDNEKKCKKSDDDLEETLSEEAPNRKEIDVKREIDSKEKSEGKLSPKQKSKKEKKLSTEKFKKEKTSSQPNSKETQELSKSEFKEKSANSEKPGKESNNLKEGETTKQINLPQSYNPNKSNYHPINDAFWWKGEKVPYIALARTFELIEETSGRLKMIEILSNYLRSVIVLSPEDLLSSIYLCLNQLTPSYKGIELGIADTTLIKAIAQCTGRSVSMIKQDMQEVGDLGLVAEGSRSLQRTMFKVPPLTVSNVYKNLMDIAVMTGSSSLNRKLNKIQSLLVACRSSEAKYLVRSLAGKLRIGLAEQSVLQSLALACAMTPPEKAKDSEVLDASKTMSSDKFKQRYDEMALHLKTTYCECPNFDLLIPTLLEHGIMKLHEKCKITPGVPMKPMLAHPTKGIHEILSRFDGMKFTCEWKYDGERAQIHINESGDVSIFSRNQENNTSKYPDIINRIKKAKLDEVKTCILDCEAVAWDTEKKQILPFQILSTRKRKDANEGDIKVQVCVFMFDLLYLNGERLVSEPYAYRRELLRKHFAQVEGEWEFVKSLDTTKMEEVGDFLEESIKGNCEGLMVKTLEVEATYEIAKRSRNWLKLKKDYFEGVGDTLDLVVLGGYKGKGKRLGTYGGFLLGCYDPDSEEYQSICKVGTGFSDDDLEKHTAFFKDHVSSKPKSYYRYDPNQLPDDWFEPVQVWEIKCADLSVSPIYRAAVGHVDPEKGISLRFPRFICVRQDKNAEDATTAEQVATMYKSQDQIKNQNGTLKVNDEDYY